MKDLQFLTPHEVAKLLRTHEQTVRDWLNNKTLVGYKFAGSWRIEQKDLLKFIAASRNA